jgi:hypothetical protein
MAASVASLADSAYPTLRKEREGWGTRSLVSREEGKDRPLMGFALLFSPRTLVRTWGTRSELCE